MRLAVPAAADPDRDKCTVLRVAAPECPSEPQCPIETAVNSARVTQEGRTFVSAQCQTEAEVPGRRRRARDLPPPPYSPAVPPPQPAPQPFQPVPLRRSARCPDSGPKACCGLPSRAPLRWAVLALAAAGLCCVAAGAALAALRPQPRAHLTLLLLMIGIGVVLVSASGVAWRLSARCGLLRARRLVARLPPSYARPHHPYAAMLYPEFHYRPPPPTYQASMQDYRLRLLLLDRAAPALSPPPTYRSNTASLVRGATMTGNWCAGSEYSQPPSYRGRALPRRPSTRPPPPAAPAPLAGVVIDSIGVETFHDLKFAHEELVLPPAVRKETSDEGKSNLVTIVQTGDVTVEPVIVTVSGSATIANTEPVHTTEIDILAHL